MPKVFEIGIVWFDFGTHLVFSISWWLAFANIKFVSLEPFSSFHLSIRESARTLVSFPHDCKRHSCFLL